jgi:hypothetical protein
MIFHQLAEMICSDPEESGATVPEINIITTFVVVTKWYDLICI